MAEKLVSTSSEKDISKWSEDTMRFALTSDVLHKSLKGSKISAMAKQFGDVFFETFKKNVKTADWYKENAPAAYKYIRSSAGRGLGVGFKEEEIVEDRAERERRAEINREMRRMSLKRKRMQEKLNREWEKEKKGRKS